MLDSRLVLLEKDKIYHFKFEKGGTCENLPLQEIFSCTEQRGGQVE